LEGCAIKIWDDNVSLGRLIGSNREHIEQAIPHIGSLLENALGQMLKNAQVVVIGTRGISRDQLQPHLRPDHIVLDLVNLKSARRLAAPNYEGICW
jgi:GDP-mannose 6-dehydrogenase